MSTSEKQFYSAATVSLTLSGQMARLMFEGLKPEHLKSKVKHGGGHVVVFIVLKVLWIGLST